MKAILRIAAMLLLLCTLTSCGGEAIIPDDGSPKMRAVITDIGEKIEVNVTEGDYGASGIYLVIINDSTAFLSKDGKSISRDALKVGDEIEIRYNGQVMSSLPPQIVAKKIIKEQ